MAFVSDESRFLDRFRVHFDLPVTPRDIKGSEVFCSTKTIDDLMDTRKWHFVVDGDCVQIAIIDEHSIGVVLLFDHYGWKRVWTGVLSDELLVE